VYGVVEGFASGELRPITLPAVAGTAGLAYRVPGSSALTVEALCFTLTTAGGGGARRVVARVQDTRGVDCYAVAAPGTHGGGLSCVYSFAPDVAPFGSVSDGFMGASFPRATLPQNSIIIVTVVNAAAGDVLDPIRLLACADPVTGGDDG